MAFHIKIDADALSDIQYAIDWYNQPQSGLGRKFLAEVKTSINSLKVNPYYQVRYDEVRCLPLKKYPYMIHFTVDPSTKVVVIRAVFNTYLDPETWKKRE
jgi:toxin ParE1/3/4